MSSANTTPIIAGGEWRTLLTARPDAARVRARLNRRVQPLLRRATLVQRVAIKYRIFRFVRRYIARRAPPGALYAARLVDVSDRLGRATSNHALESTATRL